MAIFTCNCPRCGSKRTTFDLIATTPKLEDGSAEVFGICRHCQRSATVIGFERASHQFLGDPRWVSGTSSVDPYLDTIGFVELRGRDVVQPPEHLPTAVKSAFYEGAVCLSSGCNNAAAAMFRLSLDLATKGLLPPAAEGEPNAKTRRELGLRLEYLFGQGKLPNDLKELSACVKDNGNDGAHDGNLSVEDAEDLLDFTFELLARIFTEPARIRIATERRSARRKRAN
ncbi:MAG: DUF4145 domain-containing protein [Pseudomonadota bacterium]